jgi:tetratricopeptide (TPR) repeat protein
MNTPLMRLLILSLSLGWGGIAAATSAQEYIDQADIAWSQDDLEGAEKLFLKAAEQAGDGEAALRLAGFYLGQNRLEEAVERFQQGISAGLPTPQMESRAFIGMGLSYIHLNRTALAQAALEEALRIDPSKEEQVRPLLEKLAEDSQPHP